MEDNKDVVLENFISFCDDMLIAEEGLISKIKKKLGRNKGTGKKPEKPLSETNKDVAYDVNKASSKFDYLYKTEAFCAEGCSTDDKDIKVLYDHMVKNWEGLPDIIHFYISTGKEVNQYYHLTDKNKYPDNLHFLFIDWNNFKNEFDAAYHKGKFRYFSDVVDNNARREIRNNNPNYKNYHSLYGDEWFYSTI